MDFLLGKRFFIPGIALLFLFWGASLFFTLDWDLPSKYPPETDGIPPKLSFSAREMMRADTCKYPPLQYLLVDALTERTQEDLLSEQELLAGRSRR
ncbi:MAG: hypothetical protein J6A21_01980, partial [Lentisphaeria bacterium]|nr:hypothetical protein [Lentisphaeria bacterium]